MRSFGMLKRGDVEVVKEGSTWPFVFLMTNQNGTAVEFLFVAVDRIDERAMRDVRDCHTVDIVEIGLLNKVLSGIDDFPELKDMAKQALAMHEIVEGVV